MTTEKPKAEGAAKKGPAFLYGSELLLPRSIRMTKEQSDKLDRLGGAAWVRDKIDEAKEQ